MTSLDCQLDPLYYGVISDVTFSPPPARKTKPKGRHPHKALSAAFVRSAPPGKHCDGNGLYLFVKPSGARSWIQRLVIRGRRRDFGLGSVALVSLAEAHDWMASLRRYAFARIGRMPVSEVTSGDVLGILSPIWHVKACTARLVRQRIRTVLEWAVAMEYRTDNPCDRVVSVLGPQDAVVRHMRALPHREVASALQKVRASNAMPVSMLAFEFLVLAAARWGEVRWAEWSEIDPTEAMWTVPESRMKSKREHRVPLCRRAKEILEEARALDDGAARLIFTRGGGKPLGSGQLRKLLRRNEIAAVPHWFRSSFRDWAAEETDHPREVVEAALAHVVKNKVEAAYRRTDLFERRRVLMEDWASYLAGGSRKRPWRLVSAVRQGSPVADPGV